MQIRCGILAICTRTLYQQYCLDLEGIKSDDAIVKTKEFLKLEKVTLFEAAIQTGPFLIRIDILVKDGKNISLTEVKSSSFDSSKHEDFFKKRDLGIDSEWEPYLVDVSFQGWVARMTATNCQ